MQVSTLHPPSLAGESPFRMGITCMLVTAKAMIYLSDIRQSQLTSLHLSLELAKRVAVVVIDLEQSRQWP